MSNRDSQAPPGDHQVVHQGDHDVPAPVDPVRRRDRLMASVFTVGAHVAVLTALLWPHTRPPAAAKPELALIQVSLLPTPPGPEKPEKDDAGGPQNVVQPTPPPPPTRVPSRVVVETVQPDNSDLLSESQIAGAASAGEGGGGGGGCDMSQAVQKALRRDPLVRAAVEGANRSGKSVMLWDGDWVRTGGQDGKGLSAVREAIMWEVAFVPAACRNQPMHGLILLTLEDGATRFAVGKGEWRWSDLLGLRAASAER
jgi:hypothetical protein